MIYLWCYDNNGHSMTYRQYGAARSHFVWEAKDDLDAVPTLFETYADAKTLADDLSANRRLGGWKDPRVRIKKFPDPADAPSGVLGE